MPLAPSAALVAALLLQLAAHVAVTQASPLATSVISSASVRRRLDESDVSSSGSFTSHALVWAAVAAAVVVVLVAAVLKLKSKRRTADPVVKVELEEVAISPGEPALVQTPTCTRMFVYTAHI